MSLLFDFFNFILIGTILSLSVRWGILLLKIHRVKALQNKPFDRMIAVSSKEVLLGIIRKRGYKTDLILDFKDVASPEQVKIDEDVMGSIYNSFVEQGLHFSLIPNEDVHLANKRGEISDPSNFYLNDEIMVRLSERENREIIEQDEKRKRQVAFEEKQKQQQLLIESEKQKKLQKQKEIEEQINI